MNVEKLAAKLAEIIVEAQAPDATQMEAPATSVLYTVPEASERLRCAQSTVWQLIRNEELGTVRVGRRRLVPADAITEYLAGTAAPAGARA